MGVLETLNKKPLVAAGVTTGIILLTIVAIILEIFSGKHSGLPTQCFYSDDDGATFFVDDAKLIPPFEHNGKQAVKADVFKCANGKAFVGYLERCTSDYKKRLEASQAKTGNGPPAAASANDFEMKAPLTGDAGWAKSLSHAAEAISIPHCPGGSSEIPTPEFP